ncbi:MAG: hypothetical protein IKE85_06130 [Mogibacterium sp.]|nr:hypothetical protein [Mogibacterium sp.]
MAIKHVLKNGEVLEDITGYVISREQNPEVYRVIDQIRKKGSGKNETKNKE